MHQQDEEAELDRLYAAPREEFVKLRNDLASRLRKEGDQKAANRIGRLSKPTVSAWVVNQLVRNRQLDAQRLIKAGESLEQAQQAALSGSPRGFEAARQEEGAAVRLLRAAAAETLPSVTSAVLDRVVVTLRAAAATAAGRKLLEEGRLTDDLEPVGFGAFTPMGSTAREEQPVSARMEALRRRKEEADAKAEARAIEARDLDRAAREAEQVASRAARAAATARKRAETAAEQARRVQAEIAEASKE
ncbi:MAG: hypothetical protein ACT4OP_09695 [Actinomycetota bacterium]